MKYQSLLRKPNTIRLLRLLPPSVHKQETLQCELFECTLRESDTTNYPYEALSYVWGSKVDDLSDGPFNDLSITIIDNQKSRDNQKLAVTPNLRMALLRLRHNEMPRILWVDAVCINQEDKEEKGHQIQLMAAIYAKANRVIIWLGEDQDGGARALESIRTAGENSVGPSNEEPSQQAILQLLKRSWFHRIWVSTNCIRSAVVTKCSSRFYKKSQQPGKS